MTSKLVCPNSNFSDNTIHYASIHILAPEGDYIDVVLDGKGTTLTGKGKHTYVSMIFPNTVETLKISDASNVVIAIMLDANNITLNLESAFEEMTSLSFVTILNGQNIVSCENLCKGCSSLVVADIYQLNSECNISDMFEDTDALLLIKISTELTNKFQYMTSNKELSAALSSANNYWFVSDSDVSSSEVDESIT